MADNHPWNAMRAWLHGHGVRLDGRPAEALIEQHYRPDGLDGFLRSLNAQKEA
jgi:hypothetical protein